MQTFHEYLQARQTALLNPVTMLNRLKIDLDGEHEVEVLRMTKRWKKQAAAPATRPLSDSEPAQHAAKQAVKSAMKPAQ